MSCQEAKPPTWTIFGPSARSLHQLSHTDTRNKRTRASEPKPTTQQHRNVDHRRQITKTGEVSEERWRPVATLTDGGVGHMQARAVTCHVALRQFMFRPTSVDHSVQFCVLWPVRAVLPGSAMSAPNLPAGISVLPSSAPGVPQCASVPVRSGRFTSLVQLYLCSTTFSRTGGVSAVCEHDCSLSTYDSQASRFDLGREKWLRHPHRLLHAQ